MPGLGHLLFHDHLASTLPAVTGWLEETLATVPAAAHTGG